jgi:hypothetical protein
VFFCYYGLEHCKNPTLENLFFTSNFLTHIKNINHKMTLWNENIWNTFYIHTKTLWVWIKSKKFWGVDTKLEPFEKLDQFLVTSFVEYYISKSTWEWLVLKIFCKCILFLYFSFTLIQYGRIINYGFKQMKIYNKWYFSHKSFFCEKIMIVDFYMNELVNYIYVINIEITIWYYMHKHILAVQSHGSQWAFMNTKVPWRTILYWCTRARIKHNKSC